MRLCTTRRKQGHVAAQNHQKLRQQPQGFSVNINVDTTTEAERIFHALADHGTVQMPIGETFWALRFGAVIDRFGTPWMINCLRPCPDAQ